MQSTMAEKHLYLTLPTGSDFIEEATLLLKQSESQMRSFKSR
jgi:hypothetical protein